MNTRMTSVFLLLVTGLLIGCAPDDQIFNISALTPRHQTIFKQAMADLNNEEPNAMFEASDDGRSTAYYGDPEPGDNATTYWPIPYVESWRIVFRPELQNWADEDLLRITTHELCHVLGYGHDGNPRGSSCLD